MSKLVLFDASVFLHAGTLKRHKTQYSSTIGSQLFGLEIGGIAFLLEQIAMEIKSYVDFIVVFDSKTDRKEILKDYKSNRRPNAKVLMQQHLILKVLQSAKVNILRADGLEADDLIAKAVQDNYEKYSEIVIRTGDMDMAHLIDEAGKVRIETPVSVSYDVERHTYVEVLSNTSIGKEVGEKVVKTIEKLKKGIDVDFDSYPFILDPNYVIQYNMITPFKVCFGDKSDGIREFNEDGVLAIDLFTQFSKWSKGRFKPTHLSNVKVFALFLKENPMGLESETIAKLIKRVKIFYPKKCSIDCAHKKVEIDRLKLSSAFSLFRVFYASQLLGMEFSPLTDKQKDWLRARSAEVGNGLIEVDYDMELRSKEQQANFKTEASFAASKGEQIGGF